MNTNDDNREKDAAKGEPVPLQPIIDMGSTVVKSSRGTVYCLTIVGQVEGHTLLPDNTKTTKYEHVLPLLAALEQSEQVEGLLLLLNTVGGDVEAGLALADGTLTTLDGDPQIILENVDGRVVRTISYTAQFDDEPREVCLYYTTKIGEDYSADRRVFPKSAGNGRYIYTLPRTSLAALRLDPCSPEENRTVTFTMSDITLNAADTLPAPWQYFVPSWYQAFCLVLYPALAAAAVSIVGAVVRKRK